MKRETKTLSHICYRCIRWLVRLFYPRMQVEGVENLPDEPCLVVGNHTQMHGPIACELYFPGDHRTWCAGEMLHLREVPAYAYRDFWSGKPKPVRWLYRLLSYPIAPISVCVFNQARTIAVYRDRRVVNTLKDSMKALEAGESVIIFPECAEKHNNIVNQFQEGFVDLARLYHRHTGRTLQLVPLYIAPKLKKMYLGRPVRFQPDAPRTQERQRVCAALMQAITDMAVNLPRHTVVPYSNVSRRDYPKSLPYEVYTDREETSC